ncbi:uncharacterized protein LJ206_002732 isoform 1-T1 [Theristicus caerulescens]
MGCLYVRLTGEECRKGGDNNVMCLMNTFTTVEKRETLHVVQTLDLVHTNFQNSPNVNRRLCYPFQKDLEEMQLFLPPSEKPLRCLKSWIVSHCPGRESLLCHYFDELLTQPQLRK